MCLQHQKLISHHGRSSLCRRTSLNICGTCDAVFAVSLSLLKNLAIIKAIKTRQDNQDKNRETVYGVSRFKSLSDLPYLWLITQPAALTLYWLSYKCVSGSKGSADKCWEMCCDREGYAWVFGGCGETLEARSAMSKSALRLQMWGRRFLQALVTWSFGTSSFTGAWDSVGLTPFGSG